ncbi:hypothetical protein HDU80_003012 [Chytriomyces hyalinus]|nr:hypothetical protein HDU80_003012 [Chytriomyces hyalinus]
MRQLLSSSNCAYTATLPPVQPLLQLALFRRSTALSHDGYDADHVPPSLDPDTVGIPRNEAGFIEATATQERRRKRLLVSGSVVVHKHLNLEESVSMQLRMTRMIEKSGTHFVWTERSVVDSKGEAAITDTRCLAYPLINGRSSLDTSREKHSSSSNSLPSSSSSSSTSLPANSASSNSASSKGALAAYSHSHSLSHVQVMQYSALTYNAHLIHYNRDYAMQEGYRDIVVPGTYLATIAFAHALRYLNAKSFERTIHMSRYSYMLSQPVFVNSVFNAQGDGAGKVWVVQQDRDSGQEQVVMRGEYSVA